MNTAALIYPHQLFRNHPALELTERFFLIEEPLFFNQYRFHKQKLLLHRASMRCYADYLRGKNKLIVYLEATQLSNSTAIVEHLGGLQRVFCAELDDDWLLERLLRGCRKRSIDLDILPSPAFLTPLEISKNLLPKGKKYMMAPFYREQRNRLDILVKNGRPLGGKWSFDTDNRKSLPADFQLPSIPAHNCSNYVAEAKKYIEKLYVDNPGSMEDFIYPVTFSQAEKWLDDFIFHRLAFYGNYQDALNSKNSFLFHSLLSPLLNTGLLTPQYVVERILDYGQDEKFPLNSLEGFIRQVIGWREYVRAIYHLVGKRQRSANFWNHQRAIPRTFWNGETGIPPIDSVIRRLLSCAYSNHIERLMVLGNFMLLCEFDPDQVYTWFMEFFIDAYDWVMVPNVYGMSQYADGGMIVTKPYISSSNYLRKMGDYPSGEWCRIWDGLYWSFIHKHRDFFDSNPRTRMMTVQLDRMDTEKRMQHLKVAESFLKL